MDIAVGHRESRPRDAGEMEGGSGRKAEGGAEGRAIHPGKGLHQVAAESRVRSWSKSHWRPWQFKCDSDHAALRRSAWLPLRNAGADLGKGSEEQVQQQRQEDQAEKVRCW